MLELRCAVNTSDRLLGSAMHSLGAVAAMTLVYV